MHEDYPQPYVPRYLTLPITERINSEGEIEIPLNETEVIAALRKLVEDYKVEILAVCFLWSITNAAHEKKVKEITSKMWPDIPCVLSTEVNPIIREYRRASSTVIEASVRPIAQEYIDRVNNSLKEEG